jgi:spore coat protein U-like protein
VGGDTHGESLKFTLLCRRSQGNNIVDGDANTLQSGPAISLTIPRLVSLITAGPQTINFGNFTTTTENLQVRLKSTSSVSVAVSTSNGGQMVLKNAVSPYPSNSVIPYTMTFNNIPVASGGTLANAGRAGLLTIKEWPLALTLTGGQPSGKVAGDYEDTITLTLTPGS